LNTARQVAFDLETLAFLGGGFFVVLGSPSSTQNPLSAPTVSALFALGAGLPIPAALHFRPIANSHFAAHPAFRLGAGCWTETAIPNSASEVVCLCREPSSGCDTSMERNRVNASSARRFRETHAELRWKRPVSNAVGRLEFVQDEARPLVRIHPKKPHRRKKPKVPYSLSR
jgi:hypothetical protein